MSNIWMTSKGLDVDFEEKEDETYIKVHYGELEGTFISMGSKDNQLTFETSDIEMAFKYISTRPDFATVSYGNFIHKLSWKNHNYQIVKRSKYTLVITVEENNEE